MPVGGSIPFTAAINSRPYPAFGSNHHNQLSFTDKVLSAAIATLQLVPSIDEAVFSYNLPRSRMNALYQPKRGLVCTDDNKRLRTYLFPAIDARTNRIMANKTGKSELTSHQTIEMVHGYKSSVTALLSVINYLRLLGLNVIPPQSGLTPH